MASGSQRRSAPIAAGPRCMGLFGQLQGELESVCAQNEALLAENRKLFAVLQDGGADLRQVSNKTLLQGDSFSNTILERERSRGGAQIDVLADTPAQERSQGGAHFDVFADTPTLAVRNDTTVDRTSSELSSSVPALKPSVRDAQLSQEVFREFRKVCYRGRLVITPEDLADMAAIQKGRRLNVNPARATMSAHLSMIRISSAATQNTVADHYREALVSLNEELAKSSLCQIDTESHDCIQAQTYSVMFKDADALTSLPLTDETLDTLREICQVLINHILARDIAKITDVDQSMLHVRQLIPRREQLVVLLDVVSGLVIVLNLVTITLSLDYGLGWPGWDIMEVFFTCFFGTELLVRLSAAGPSEYFCGPDMSWNLFDLLVVSFGLFDCGLTLMGWGSGNTPQATLARILRLLRIVKMVRVLRIKMLKELRMMVNGLFAGLRVITWAFVFLFFFILMLGITARQLISFHPDLTVMFGTVPRSMLTCFQCFIAGTCVDPQGRPLVPILLEELGPVVIIVYVVCFALLTFGLFNLIMATIVESTMQAGKADDVKRIRQRQREHVQLALTVQELVQALCSVQEESHRSSRSKLGQSFGDLSRSLFKRDSGLRLRGTLMSRISTRQFIQMLDRADIQELFDRLGVKLVDPTQYIDSLDANDDGMLSIADLVRGLLKLRGNVEKADVVATLMVARDVQRSLQSVEALLTHGAHVTRTSLQGTRNSGDFTALSTERRSCDRTRSPRNLRGRGYTNSSDGVEEEEQDAPPNPGLKFFHDEQPAEASDDGSRCGSEQGMQLCATLRL